MWKMTSHAACGRGHDKTDTPCQDKTFTLYQEGVYAIALADGAGSASHSEYGAEIVVNTIAGYLCSRFDDIINNSNGIEVKASLIKEVQAALAEGAEKNRCNLNDLASTLLAVAVKGNSFLICHLGDGVIGYVKKGNLKVISMPDNGEFVNSTVFITSSSALTHFKLFKGQAEGVSGFVIMSDGAAESFYQKKTSQLSPAIKKIIDWSILLPEAKIQEMLVDSFERLILKNTLDDCSVAFLVNATSNKVHYNALQFADKCDLLNIPKTSYSAKKQIRRFDEIVGCLNEQPLNLPDLAKRLHYKSKYLKRKVRKLCAIGLVQQGKERYFSSLDNGIIS